MKNDQELEKIYRNRTETQREWLLKCSFIKKNKKLIENDDYLTSLAQCYVNIETMGCR
jgi:hypothetical protein